MSVHRCIKTFPPSLSLSFFFVCLQDERGARIESRRLPFLSFSSLFSSPGRPAAAAGLSCNRQGIINYGDRSPLIFIRAPGPELNARVSRCSCRCALLFFPPWQLLFNPQSFSTVIFVFSTVRTPFHRQFSLSVWILRWKHPHTLSLLPSRPSRQSELN